MTRDESITKAMVAEKTIVELDTGSLKRILTHALKA